MATTDGSNWRSPRTWRLIAGVAAGLVAGRAVAVVYGITLVPAVLKSGNTASQAGLVLGLAGLGLSFALGVLTAWIAKWIAKGRSAAVWWLVGVSALLSVVNGVFAAWEFGAGAIVSIGLSVLLNFAVFALGALISLALPPREARLDETFD